MPGHQQVSIKERLAGAFIGLGLCLLALPVAVVATIGLMPLWRWLENTFAIESVGHSGPSEWCYVLTYLIVVSLFGFVWFRRRRRRRNE